MQNLNIQAAVENIASTIYNDQIALINNLKEVDSLLKTSILVEGFFLSFILKGTAQLVIDGETINFKEGDIFACKPDNILEKTMVSLDNDIRAMLFTKEIVQRIADMVNLDWTFIVMLNHHEVLHAEPEELEQILRLYDLLYHKMQKPDTPNKTKAIDSLLCVFVYDIFDIHSRTCETGLPQQTYTAGEHLFQRFIKMLENPKQKYLSVNGYAEHLNVTPKYFSSVCKRLSGKTANEIITEAIIKNAKIMLHDNSISIKQVAANLNFVNQSHFGTFFRRHMGMSPQQFRQNCLTTTSANR